MTPLGRIALGVVLAPITLLGTSYSARPDLADAVTIYRDTYGIPHVFGETDAATAFGFGYAQAEDHFRQLEENFIRGSGRLAEAEGEGGLRSDRLNRALEIPRLAKEEYARLDRDMRALVDGYAAGINYYLEEHPEVHPRLLERVEGWQPLAFIRYNYYQGGFAGGALEAVGLRSASPGEEAARAGQGSNGWAIAPSNTTDGHALLFINPHLPYFGPGQVYEGHLHSATGWNFTGYTRFGFPLPYVGHNDRAGWVSTDNAADLADLYLERFDHPTDSLAYRYGDAYRVARAWQDTILVRGPDGPLVRVFHFRATHHGPIVGVLDGRPVALRLAKLDADGWLREWYDMTRAGTVAEFRQAMRPLAMQFGNVMYADQSGDVYYLYNGAVPRRDPGFDWSRPVDGSDPRTEWQGFHTIDELPQLLNPASGWMQNCNGTPFLLTDRDNPDRSAFPSYMAREPDTRRAMMSRRILAGRTDWTLDGLAEAAFDTHVLAADSLLPGWLAALRTDAGTPRRAEAIRVLAAWDHRSDTASVAMTLFERLADRVGPRPDLATIGYALDAALAELERDFGTWRVEWGKLNRLQRWDPFRKEAPSDGRPSLPLASVESALGGIFTTWPIAVRGQRRRYSVGGGSYVSIVEFGPTIRARAVHTFGESGNPASPHFLDQAPLFASGTFRPAWFTLDEIRANLERAYRPGQE